MYAKLYVLLAILCIVIAVSAADLTPKKGQAATVPRKGSYFFIETDKENTDSTENPPFIKGLPKFLQEAINALQASKLSTPELGTDPSKTGGFACNSLIDEQYPVFSDMCGALPQARYSLPNTFGHNDRWQLSHILTSLMSSVTDPTCVRALRTLLCPMLFQPCRIHHEPPLVLPCQYYCSLVKSKCPSAALDMIPCETLPYHSDYCPRFPTPAQTAAPVFPQQQYFQVTPGQAENSPAARSFVNTPVRPAEQGSATAQQVTSPSAAGTAPGSQTAPTANANNRPGLNTYPIRAQYIPPMYPLFK